MYKLTFTIAQTTTAATTNTLRIGNRFSGELCGVYAGGNVRGLNINGNFLTELRNQSYAEAL